MDNLSRIIHMATTDPDFRAALLADPEGTLTQWNLDVSAEELATLARVAHLFALPSDRLLGHLLSAAVGPDQQWPGLLPSTEYATVAR